MSSMSNSWAIKIRFAHNFDIISNGINNSVIYYLKGWWRVLFRIICWTIIQFYLNRIICNGKSYASPSYWQFLPKFHFSFLDETVYCNRYVGSKCCCKLPNLWRCTTGSKSTSTIGSTILSTSSSWIKNRIRVCYNVFIFFY